ncbi:MAG: cell division protein FtsA [Candidatus Methylacidiphilales bacterium]
MFWSNDRNIIVALEIGSCKIVCAVAELRSDGTLALLGVGEEPSGQVRKCEIVDFDTAQRCVHDALMDAEKKTDVMINEVYLAISGAHIRGTNTRVSTVVHGENDEITEDVLKELKHMACRHALPMDHALIHDLLQHYILDDSSITDNPIGLASKRLAADYHLVYGLATRLQTTIRCVKELSIDVKNFALSSYATAQAILPKSLKQLGAVVINCGGGVTDYIAYDRGAVVHTGVLGVGGEHLTNDIVAGLKIPYAKAEALKRLEGSVTISDEQLDDQITIPASYNFEERKVWRESLVKIMEARQLEIFEIILHDLSQQPFWADFGGSIYLTGGASHTRGILDLASTVFPYPVEYGQTFPFEGNQNYANRPDLTTVLGLLQYARQAELEAPPVKGWARMRQSIKRMFGNLRLV